MRTLIMMVGLPRSGKSTIVSKLQAAGIPVVCPDSIRDMIHGKPFIPEYERVVWSMVEYLVDELLQEHDNVVLDATNLTTSGRFAWTSRFTSETQVKYIYVDTQPSVCIGRAHSTGQDYLVPIIEKMDKTKQIPPHWADQNCPEFFDWKNYLAKNSGSYQ